MGIRDCDCRHTTGMGTGVPLVRVRAYYGYGYGCTAGVDVNFFMRCTVVISSYIHIQVFMY